MLVRYSVEAKAFSYVLSQLILEHHNISNYYWILQLSVYVVLIYSALAGAPSRYIPYSIPSRGYIASLVTVIIVFRLPSFLMDPLNPDESQELSSAITLLSDPVYWRSVAIATHGPLVTLPLLIPHFFGLKIDYGSTRLIGALLMGGSASFMYLSIRKFCDEREAKLLILPVATFLAVTKANDFIAYNGEYAVVFLMMLEIFLLSCITEGKLNKVLLLFAGFVVGAMPFAKMQSIPLVLVLGGLGITLLVIKHGWSRHWRYTLWYIGGVLVFQLLVVGYLIAFGLTEEFIVRYIQCTFNYVDNDVSFISKLQIFINNLKLANYEAGWYFFAMIAVIVGFSFMLLLLRYVKGSIQSSDDKQKSKYHFVLYLYALALISASVLAITLPGTGYIHYYLLLVFPLAVSAAITLNYFTGVSSFHYGACVSWIFGIGLSVVQLFPLNIMLAPKESLPSLAEHYHDYWGNDAISSIVKRYLKHGEKLAVWGWTYEYYLLTGATMAVRTPMEVICDGRFEKQINRFVGSYASELKNSKAPVIIDSVAPGSFAYKNKLMYGFHLYPPIAKVIHEGYVPVEEWNGVVVYVSKRRLLEIRQGVFRLNGG